MQSPNLTVIEGPHKNELNKNCNFPQIESESEQSLMIHFPVMNTQFMKEKRIQIYAKEQIENGFSLGLKEFNEQDNGTEYFLKILK